jgi:hypothetical protein
VLWIRFKEREVGCSGVASQAEKRDPVSSGRKNGSLLIRSLTLRGLSLLLIAGLPFKGGKERSSFLCKITLQDMQERLLKKSFIREGLS